MASKLTRKACRNREMIGGIDAQLLEHALTQVEQEVATLSARLAAVEESLEFARNYNGIEGRPCPLCTYEDGVFIKSCQMHTDLAAAIQDRDEAIENLKTGCAGENCCPVMDEVTDLTTRLAAAEDVVEAAFEFAAGFGETISRVNMSNLRAALTEYDKVTP